MTMLRLDLSDGAATNGVDLGALEAENASLRAYLKRVLEVLERQADERDGRGMRIVEHVEPGILLEQQAVDRLAGVEAGLERIERDLQAVLWHVRGDERPPITSVD